MNIENTSGLCGPGGIRMKTLWEWEKTEVAKLSKRVREHKSAERIVGAP